ncbi:MAG: HAMP domain-containing sensor histidine kinase [Gammaproteobacteria bacterium]
MEDPLSAPGTGVHEREARFRAFLTATSHVLYTMSPDWRVMRRAESGNFVAATTQPDEHWLAKYIPQDSHGLVLAAIEAAIRTQSTFELEHRVFRADETIGWTLSCAVPIRDARGDIVEWFGAAREITAQKQIEEAVTLQTQQYQELLKAALANEQQARLDAESANRLKDEFLAKVSHELRTPLNAIMGWTELLQTHDLDEETSARALETIDRNVRIQGQLIEDLLDVSKIIMGKLRLDVTQVDVIAVTEAAMEGVRRAAKNKEIHLDAIIDRPLRPVTGDSVRIQQIVWNLLSNAIKFTPKGGRVGVQLKRVNSHVELTVADNGAGIQQDFLPFIFNRFRQVDSAPSQAHGGLGLGLAIVRHLTELHGGTVRVESAGEGKGTTFTVCLPLATTT